MLSFARAVTLCALLLASTLLAQNPGTGLYAHGTFDAKGFDTINTGNLNTHFEIPIVSKAGRGLPFHYSIVYDGLIWSPVVSNGTPQWLPDPSWGFHAQLNGAAMIGYLTSQSKLITCPHLGSGPIYSRQQGINYTYLDPYGKSHLFNYASGYTCPGYSPTPASGTGAVSDGSGYTFDGTYVHTGSGQTILPTQDFANSGSITDSNGNEITYASGSYTDTTGHVVLTSSGTGTPGSPLTLTYPVTEQANSATTAAAIIYYTNYTVQTNFGCPVGDYPASTIGLVDHITLATGDTYSFTYESTPGGSGGAVTGRLASIKLPTGGTISYTYYGGPSGANGMWCPDGSVPAMNRVTSDGTKTYARGGISGNANAFTTTVTDERGKQTYYWFSVDSLGLYEATHRRAHDGTASNTNLLEEDITCFNNVAQSNGTCDGQAITAPITEADTTTTYNYVAIPSLTTRTYDATGSYIQKTNIYNGSTLLTSTINTYASPGSVTEHTETLTEDSSGNVVSDVSYGYDETTRTATSGIPQHGTPSAYPGNQTSVHVLINSNPPSSTLSTSTTYYDTGMPVSTTAPGGFTTTYGYDATQAFRTSTTLPTPSSGVGLSTSAAYDIASGAALSATGMNSGQTSTFTQYDPLLRLMAAKSPNQGSLGQGLSDATYSPNEVDTSTAMNASQSTFQKTFLDSYGRTVRTAVQSSSGWYLTDTCYTNGVLQAQSTPYLSSSPNPSSYNCLASNATQYTFDGLGRTTQIATPDGHSVTERYNGRAVQVVDSNGQTRILQKDLLGRLVGVCEIASGTWDGGDATQACGNSNTGTFDISGSGFTTAYVYNLAQHTASLYQGEQTRVFTTDAAGRSTSTVEPESGTTAYTYTYNGTGLQVVRTRPKANQIYRSTTTSTTTQYDSIGRIVQVQYSDGTPTKTFTYDQPGNGGSIPNAGSSKGQLTQMSNGVHGRSYAYDIMGRVSESVECLPGWCSGQPVDRDAYRWYQYDLASDLTYEAYTTQANQGGAYSVAYGYNTAGQLTSFVDGQNNASGAPNIYTATASSMQPGGPQFITYGNNVTAYRAYDTMDRLGGQWVCGPPGGYNCPGSQYFYGFGLVMSGSKLTAETDTVNGDWSQYSYDPVGNLSIASNWQGNASNGFAAGYDRYGNRWNESVPHTASGTGPDQSLSFNIANNQINSPGYVYDAAGNLMSITMAGVTHTYQYDADNNLVSIDNGSTAQYWYSTLNERDAVSNSAGVVSRFGYDAQGRRATQWDNSTGYVTETQYYANGQPVAFWSAADGNIHFEHGDWLGTERMRTDLAGNHATAATFSSLPFGEPNATAGSDLDPAHFTGLDQDGSFSSSSLQLHHAMFREYSSLLGRWLSPDPSSGSYDPTHPQTLNRYTYALNNPLSLTDPDGEDTSGGLCYWTASNCGAGGGGGGVGGGGYSLGTYDLYSPTLGYTTSAGNGPQTYEGDASAVINGYNPGIMVGSDGTIYAGGSIQGSIVSFIFGNAPGLDIGSWYGGTGGGGSTGGGTGGGGSAPNNNQQNPRSTLCTVKVGAGIALDTAGTVAGLIPGASTALVTTQVTLGLASTAYSAYNGSAGFTVANATGAQVSAFAAGAEYVGWKTLAKNIPYVATAYNAFALGWDVYHAQSDYQECLAGH